MDKKTGIIIGIITAVVVILVAVVFAIEANTEPVDNSILLTINGTKYSVDEFETFAKLSNHDNGDINKIMTEQEALTMLDKFLISKLYYNAATSHNIQLESGDLEKFNKDYDEKVETFLTANVSKDDYVEYKTEETLNQSLKSNMSKYYSLPAETYDAIKKNFESGDMYKTYAFRMMTIPYEAPKSGDSGDVGASGDALSGDASGDVSGDKEDLSREAQLLVAQDVLARVKSGDDFEALSKEYGSTRFTFKGNQYTLVNGDLEYAAGPLLSSKLGNEDLYNAVIKLSSGDTTDLVEDEKYTSFQIVKVEALEDGFVGEGEKELKEILLNEYADDIVSQGANYEMNQGAFVRMMYKKD